MLPVILDGLQQLDLRLFAEPGEFSSLPLLADTLQILHGGDPKLIVERLDLLGSQTLQLEQLENSFGEGSLQLLVVFQTTRGHQFGDLLRDRLADPLDFPKTPLGNNLLDRLAQGFQSPCGIRISTDFERIFSLEFKQLGDVLEDLTDMSWRFGHSLAMLPRQASPCHQEP